MLNHPLVPKFIETPVEDTLPLYHKIAQMCKKCFVSNKYPVGKYSGENIVL